MQGGLVPKGSPGGATVVICAVQHARLHSRARRRIRWALHGCCRWISASGATTIASAAPQPFPARRPCIPCRSAPVWCPAKGREVRRPPRPAAIDDGGAGRRSPPAASRPWSMTFIAASSVMVMMREPPGLPTTMKVWPSLEMMVGHRTRRTLAGLDGVLLPLDEPEEIGDAGLRGEVVHLVVEEEAGVAGDHPGAEAGVDGVGHRHRVAVLVDDGIVRRLGSLVRRSRRARPPANCPALPATIFARIAAA